ncbi:hypothetical protein REPUB_Repub06bG0180100 [Reevesia pubescens]
MSFLNKWVANPVDRSLLWMVIWKADVPPKIKFFLWRLLWNILPTRSNLNAKGIACYNSCVVCGRHPESTYHIFFTCNFSRTVWLSLCPELVQMLTTLSSPDSFWDDLLSKASEVSHLRVVLCSLWFLWTNRNNCLYKDCCFTPSTFCHLVHNLFMSFPVAKPVSTSICPSPVISWCPPADNVVKINVDASYNANNRTVGLGMVARDCSGSILLCAVTSVRFMTSPLHAKMRAILFGLKLALEEGYDRLLVESDARLAISEINHAESSLWEGGSLTMEILRFYRLCSVCTFVHARRQANSLAHNIAKISCNPGFQRV